ncbi:hypothetical protein ACFFSW_37105 [Saccharothrix longispora]|uniref:Uncharacterized protein n=1 Tax=Saccharothrix longispora TaxID=33920 RepID=A0ABU1PPS8_9PSEU|nr:hypothetical protein [Saccharothrix longispora]MDR6592672.1 hypothetical protein [Saccharothrix longispora]
MIRSPITTTTTTATTTTATTTTATATTDVPTDGEARTHRHGSTMRFDTPAPVSAVLDIPAGHVRFVAADRTDTAVEVRPANVKLALTGMA